MYEHSLVEFVPRYDNWSQASFCKSLGLLLYRNIVFIKREPLVLAARIGIAVAMGLFALSVFWNIEGPTLLDDKNMVGSMFFLCSNIFTGVIYGTIGGF